jgi:hypothetical protein
MNKHSSSEQKTPVAVVAAQTAPRTKPSIYPEPFASRMAGRVKHPLGDRSAGDAVVYPDDDLQAAFVEGKWQFAHKDGSPY